MAEDRGDERHDGPDDEHAELLERPQNGIERLRQVVDRLEDRLLDTRHRAVADRQHAGTEHDQADGDRHDVAAPAHVPRARTR